MLELRCRHAHAVADEVARQQRALVQVASTVGSRIDVDALLSARIELDHHGRVHLGAVHLTVVHVGHVDVAEHRHS